jgi:uncharacterized protein
MRTYKDAKSMAKTLRDALSSRNVSLSHSECLEIVAHQFGLPDWNTLSAKLVEQPEGGSAGTIESERRPIAAASGSESNAALQPAYKRMPLIPMRDAVVYPGVMMPIFIGRLKSIESAEMAMREDKRIVLFAIAPG